MGKALSTIHAPRLGRHGWIEQRPSAEGGTMRHAPADCPALGTHASWRYGFLTTHRTPAGYHATVVLSPSRCVHTPPPAPPEQGTLW